MLPASVPQFLQQLAFNMDDPDGDKPKKPRKTLADRRKEAREAVSRTRQLMEAEARQRDREWELAMEQERACEEERKQAELKALQEQHDHDLAVAMSTSTPTENPLLLPREVHGQQKKQPDSPASLTLPAERKNKDMKPIQTKTISHSLHCDGCGGIFVGTKNLKSHVNENPLCLKFWGDDLKSLSQKVTAIFKRRRSSRHFNENRDEVLARRMEDYWADSKKQCDRKQTHYKANEEKERKRKRVAYEANKEKERERKRSKNEDEAEKQRLRQSVVRVTRAETQTTLTDLLNFEKEGRYGPIFPCVSCGQLNWYFAMSVQNRLEELPQNLVDTQYVHENISLFRKQNRFFICRPCKNDLNNGKCPKMSVKNHLQCPWKDVPRHLLTINPVRFYI